MNTSGGLRSLSWTGAGVLIPCEEKPSEVFKAMFTQGSPAQVKAQVKKLERGQSILDAVAGQARDLKAKLPARDRDRSSSILAASVISNKGSPSARNGKQNPNHRPRPGAGRYHVARGIHGQDAADV